MPGTAMLRPTPPAEATRTRPVWPGLLPVIMAGGLGGVSTATEAAVAAVLYSLAISLLVCREIRFRDLWPVLIRTGGLTGMVLLLLAPATPVGIILTTSLVPQRLVQAASGISTNLPIMLAGRFQDSSGPSAAERLVRASRRTCSA